MLPWVNFSVLNLIQVEEWLEVLPVPGGGDAVLSVPGVVVVVGEVIHQVE